MKSEESGLQMGAEEINPNTVIGEVQLLLAEKRTALAVLRTGIAVLALPVSVLGLLVATSRYYHPLHVLSFFIPLVGLLTFLFLLGVYLVFHSISRMHDYDRLIRQIKSDSKELAQFIE